MKHIIVFGAFGLVGSNFIESSVHFLERPFKVTKIKCDEVPDNLELADYIYYGSGYGQPQKFGEDKLKTIQINTASLLEAFTYLKPDGKFIYISTSEVYSGADSPNTESVLGTTTPQHPRACYIESKRCGEAICESYRSLGYDVKIARLALAYGPGTKKNDTRVINQLIEQGLKGEITLRDGGEAIRTYLYIKDAVELLWKILLKGKKSVYNVGGFSTLSILELAQEIAKQMDATLTIPQINTGLYDAPQRVELDMSRTLKDFDQHFTPLSQGLRETIKYQKELYGIK